MGKERNGDDVRIEMATGLDAVAAKDDRQERVAYGVGNHSGVNTGMILLPMPPATGIVFEHMPDGERIPAFVDYVYSSGFASSLKGKECTILTVEHLLAACHMYGLTNLLVKVSEEVPMFDGSAQDICAKSRKRAIEQKQGVEPLTVRGKNCPREPAEAEVPLHRAGGRAGDRLYAGIPPPHRQAKVRLQGRKGELFDGVAPARTFGSIDDFEQLAKAGVGSGGRISNVMQQCDPRGQPEGHQHGASVSTTNSPVTRCSISWETST